MFIRKARESCNMSLQSYRFPSNKHLLRGKLDINQICENKVKVEVSLTYFITGVIITIVERPTPAQEKKLD